MEYTVSWGNKHFKGDAEKVYLEICSIGDEVKPEQMVSYAENNPDSELYKCFTWDNDIAADKYRIFEARQIHCNLQVTYKEDDSPKKEPYTVRATYRTSTDVNAGYIPTVKIVRNEDLYQGMLKVAISELKSFERKYRHLSELKPIWALIEDL